jgi:hypothetical protein
LEAFDEVETDDLIDLDEAVDDGRQEFGVGLCVGKSVLRETGSNRRQMFEHHDRLQVVAGNEKRFLELRQEKC